MIVCHCYKVTHKQIQKCVDEGVCDLKGLKEACRACTGCGGCFQSVKEQLLIALRTKNVPQPTG